MVEAVLAEITNNRGIFPNFYRQEINTVYFAPIAWHSWWLNKRKGQGRTVFELNAIMNQLFESPYTTNKLEPMTDKKVLMIGINLQKAHAQGLEVPIRLNVIEGFNAHE